MQSFVLPPPHGYRNMFLSILTDFHFILLENAEDAAISNPNFGISWLEVQILNVRLLARG